MFSYLPYFIRREIIDYTVSRDHREYCLLNKEWFTYKAGQFMIIDDKVLLNNKRSSHWFYLAENLSLSRFFNIKWEFLNRCLKIKNAEFTFNSDIKINLRQLKCFISSSRIQSVNFILNNLEMNNLPYQLLELISKQLKILDIAYDYLDYEKLLSFEYPNLVEYGSMGLEQLEDLARFNECMPKVEHLFLRVGGINFQNIPAKSNIFYHLTKLTIAIETIFGIRGSDFPIDVFDFHFPCLKDCELRGYFPINPFERISKSMSKLKILSFDISLTLIESSSFPNVTLPELEELNFLDGNEIELEVPIYLSLNKLPKIRKLGVGISVNIKNSNEDVRHLVTSLAFYTSYFFECKTILGELPNVNKISVDCFFFDNCLYEVFEMSTCVTDLQINSISSPIQQKFLPPGPFKTTHLKLSGSNFLTNNLIQWMAQQPQLLHLSLELFSNEVVYTEPVFFPYLISLTIIGESIETELYLRSILLYEHNF